MTPPAVAVRYATPCQQPILAAAGETADGIGMRDCGATPTRQYVQGHRCADHTPARQAGRPEPATPDPARAWKALTPLPDGASRLADDRAIASGKRRASPARYQEAVQAEEARKAREAERRRGSPRPVRGR
jgi:hypothetical protein